MRNRATQRGALMIAAIILIVVFAVLGLSLLSLHSTQRVTASDHFAAARALYLAESGLEWAARELFGTADPQADCEALVDENPVTLGAGSFQFTEAVYDAGNVTCSIISVGDVGVTRRRVTGAIRREVLEGTSGGIGETLFSDEGAWQGGGENINFDNGSIIFDRPGSPGKGKPPAQAIEAENVITDDFQVGDDVYFTGNFSYDGTMGGSVFFIEIDLDTKPPQTISCTVDLETLTSPCGAVNELNEHYNVVLFLENNFSPAMVDRVRVRVDWDGGTSQQLRVDDACIGRISHCMPDSGGDPVDPESWEEVRLEEEEAEAPTVAAAS